MALWEGPVAYSWDDKRCVGMAEDTQPSESTGWMCRAKACTPAALLGDNRTCSQDSAGTVSWTQLAERLQKRAREWVKLKSQSWLQCPCLWPCQKAKVSWPFLFNTMDIPCGAEAVECYADPELFWEYLQWPVCEAFVTGKHESSKTQDPLNPNELIRGSFVQVCFLSVANAKRACLNHSNRG